MRTVRLEDLEVIYEEVKLPVGFGVTKVSVVRTFQLNRLKDESGISGTGIVAVGVSLPTGRVVIEWLGEHNSITMFENIDEMLAVHGHNGSTEIVWTKTDA